MNKRGDIATLLLPLVALAFSLMALFSFLSFDKSFENNSREINEMMNEADFAKQYVLKMAELILRDSINCNSNVYGDICKEQMRERIMAIASKRDLEYYGAGNFFGKIRTDDFLITEGEEGYIFDIKGVFVQSKRGDNNIRRDFDIVFEFDSSGKLITKKTV